MRYDHHTDKFIRENEENVAVITIPNDIIEINKVVEVSDDSIEMIADAVVRKLTEKERVMAEIKLTKRYPNSRTEDITDAYMRGWNDALDAVQNGKFHIADTPQTEEFKNLDREALILLIECQKERIEELLADKDTPQTDCIIADARLKAHCLNCAESGSYKCKKCDGEMYYKDTPQTDCSWK